MVRRIKGKNSAGIQRVTWDLRYSDLDPASDKDRNKDDAFAFDQSGPLALPGDYIVMVQKSENGKLSTIVEKASFKVTSLGLNTLEEKVSKIDKLETDLEEIKSLLKKLVE